MCIFLRSLVNGSQYCFALKIMQPTWTDVRLVTSRLFVIKKRPTDREPLSVQIIAYHSLVNGSQYCFALKIMQPTWTDVRLVTSRLFVIKTDNR